MNKIPIGTRVIQKSPRKHPHSGNCISFWDGKVGVVVAYKGDYTGVYFEDHYCSRTDCYRGHNLDAANPYGRVGGWWFCGDDLDVIESKVQVDKKYEDLYT